MAGLSIHERWGSTARVMIHNGLVLIAELGIAALVAFAVPVLRGERDLRGWWDGTGIAIFILVFVLLCVGSVELGWLRRLW